jgi:thymidine phosphorylase
VVESIETLQGKGPDDLVELTVALAEEMLALAGVDADPRSALEDGSALERWRAMVAAQGGDADAALPEASDRRTSDAPTGGFLSRLDARAVGMAAWRLGAGRARKEDPVSAAAGVVCLKKPGDAVEEGEPILELHTDDPGRFEHALSSLRNAIEIAPEPPASTLLVIEHIHP